MSYIVLKEELKPKLAILPDEVSQKIRNKIVLFVAKLHDTYRENLRSVILYGSILISGEYIAGFSDINFLVVLNELDLFQIRKIKKPIREFIKFGFSPVFTTLEYINSSLDTFPIEYSDIKDNRLVLYGEDIFSNISINNEHLRLQLERELKTNLIKLQQAYLHTRSRKEMTAIIGQSFRALLPLFRAFLRLNGINPVPTKKSEIIEKVTESAELNLQLLKLLLSIKEGKEKLEKVDWEMQIDRYLNLLKTLIQRVETAGC